MWGKRRRYVFRKRSKRGRALWLAAGLLLLITVVELVWLVPSWPTSPTGSNVQAPPLQAAPPEERAEPEPVEDSSGPQGTKEGEEDAVASEDAPPPLAEEEGATVASPAAPPERLAPPPSQSSPALPAPSSPSSVGPTSPSVGGKAGVVPEAPLRAPNGYANPGPNYYYPDYSWGYGPSYPDYSWGYGGTDYYYYWDYEPDYWGY